MHTTIAFCEEGAVNTEENIAAVSDQHARVSGNDIYIGKYNQIISMFGGGASTSWMRIKSPSLRRLFCPYIHPYYSSAADAYWVVKPMYMPDSPIPLETNEALEATAKSTEFNANIDNFVGVSLAEGVITPVSGDIRTMVIEADLTLTQKTWCNGTLTLPVDLPVGRYQIVGAQCRSGYPGIFRFVPIGADHRPGGMVDAGAKMIDTTGQRQGKLGVWCEFDQLTPPSIEICLNVTGGWYSLKVDLIKVG